MSCLRADVEADVCVALAKDLVPMMIGSSLSQLGLVWAHDVLLVRQWVEVDGLDLVAMLR